MKHLILHPTDICQWHALVNQAQVAAHLNLSENTESYLVFLLQRFAQNPALIDTVLASDFLEALHRPAKQKMEQLREVGDKSLVLCGLFPGVAQRRSLALDYYTHMGQAAYLTLSELQEAASAELFLQLGQHFGALQKTLQTMRGEFYQFAHESNGALWIHTDSNQH